MKHQAFGSSSPVTNHLKVAWLNPIPKRYWSHPTIQLVSKTLPMFELTLEGIDEAINTYRFAW